MERNKMIVPIEARYFWPALKREDEKFAKHCYTCQAAKRQD